MASAVGGQHPMWVGGVPWMPDCRITGSVDDLKVFSRGLPKAQLLMEA